MIVIIISILAILGWTSLFKQTFSTKEGFKYVYEPISKILSALDFKPLNCAYCLSFWIGLGLSIASLDICYMVVFLYFAFRDGNDLVEWFKNNIDRVIKR
tara:strand:- start:150 stop:449 length:300 start_codon:yes stop_codon:yes gene_type:complete